MIARKFTTIALFLVAGCSDPASYEGGASGDETSSSMDGDQNTDGVVETESKEYDPPPTWDRDSVLGRTKGMFRPTRILHRQWSGPSCSPPRPQRPELDTDAKEEKPRPPTQTPQSAKGDFEFWADYARKGVYIAPPYGTEDAEDTHAGPPLRLYRKTDIIDDDDTAPCFNPASEWDKDIFMSDREVLDVVTGNQLGDFITELNFTEWFSPSTTEEFIAMNEIAKTKNTPIKLISLASWLDPPGKLVALLDQLELNELQALVIGGDQRSRVLSGDTMRKVLARTPKLAHLIDYSATLTDDDILSTKDSENRDVLSIASLLGQMPLETLVIDGKLPQTRQDPQTQSDRRKPVHFTDSGAINVLRAITSSALSTLKLSGVLTARIAETLRENLAFRNLSSLTLDSSDPVELTDLPRFALSEGDWRSLRMFSIPTLAFSPNDLRVIAKLDLLELRLTESIWSEHTKPYNVDEYNLMVKRWTEMLLKRFTDFNAISRQALNIKLIVFSGTGLQLESLKQVFKGIPNLQFIRTPEDLYKRAEILKARREVSPAQSPPPPLRVHPPSPTSDYGSDDDQSIDVMLDDGSHLDPSDSARDPEAPPHYPIITNSPATRTASDLSQDGQSPPTLDSSGDERTPATRGRWIDDSDEDMPSARVRAPSRLGLTSPEISPFASPLLSFQQQSSLPLSAPSSPSYSFDLSEPSGYGRIRHSTSIKINHSRYKDTPHYLQAPRHTNHRSPAP